MNNARVNPGVVLFCHLRFRRCVWTANDNHGGALAVSLPVWVVVEGGAVERVSAIGVATSPNVHPCPSMSIHVHPCPHPLISMVSTSVRASAPRLATSQLKMNQPCGIGPCRCRSQEAACGGGRPLWNRPCVNCRDGPAASSPKACSARESLRFRLQFRSRSGNRGSGRGLRVNSEPSGCALQARARCSVLPRGDVWPWFRVACAAREASEAATDRRRVAMFFQMGLGV
jgi:hypothetical protein